MKGSRMIRSGIRFACLLPLLAAGIVGAARSSAAASAAACWEEVDTAGVYTHLDPNLQRWGWTQTVHSTACNHWGNVQLHEPLPTGYQANVTLTRTNVLTGDTDHRYCYVKANGRTCHTDAILTTACFWDYFTDTVIYHWTD